MKKSSILFFLAWSFFYFETNGQSVAINNDASLPFVGAILDAKSANKGVLIPRVALTGTNDITTLPNRSESLLIYNTATVAGVNGVSPGYYYWRPNSWIKLVSLDNTVTGGWLLGGNSGTIYPNQFLGTIDDQPLVFKVNSQKAGLVFQSGNGSVFWGYLSGNGNSAATGRNNIAIGMRALFTNVNTSNLVAIGDSSLMNNSTGFANTSVGSRSLFSNAIGSSNSAFGYRALYSNIIGNFNSAIGYEALASNTGPSNTALGGRALSSNTSGGWNAAVGIESLFSNTSGFENTAIGSFALRNNLEGVQNTATGYGALQSDTFGNLNTANGYKALYSFDIGSQNTAIGANALLGLRTGNNNTGLGYMANVSMGSLANATAIGANALVNASNKVRIGNSSVTVIEGQVDFTFPSDGRFKYNTKEDVSGLDFIMKLRPVTYQFDTKKFDQHLFQGSENSFGMQASNVESSSIRRTGFIAQEVEKAANETGFDFHGINKPKSAHEYYGLSYSAFVVPLVKAMQEQQQLINQQKDELQTVKTELAELKKMIEKISNK